MTYEQTVAGLARWQPTLLHVFESTSRACGYSLDDLTDGIARGGSQSLRYWRRCAAVVAREVGCPVAVLAAWLGPSHRTVHQWVTPGNYQRDRLHPKSLDMIRLAMFPTDVLRAEP